MAEPLNNDQLFCWEQIARSNPLFRISRVFAPQFAGERLLPLYALFATLEHLCSQDSEAEIKQRKLEWWRRECLGQEPTSSDHPILRELTRSGAAAHLERTALKQLFDGAELRLDGPAPADFNEFEALCRLIGLPQCVLELAVFAAQPAPGPATAACIGLSQLLREGVGPGGAARLWWMPLNLLARHGISRGELALAIDAPSAQALFAEVISRGGTWSKGAKQEMQRMTDAPAAARHLAVHAHLQIQAVQRLEGRRPGAYPAALRRVGWRQLYQAWRAARRFNRR